MISSLRERQRRKAAQRRRHEPSFRGRAWAAVFSLGLWVFGGLGISVAAPDAEPIPAHEIKALKHSLAQMAAEDSNVAKRRQLKNTARKAQALLDHAPEAPNRFELLGVIFDCQKHLLAMDNTERQRNEFFETCKALAGAPDEYAEIRLEADLMLSEKELSEKDATLDERAEALAALIERYKDTAGEAKSLLMGALIARKLDSPELERFIYYTLDEQFSDDPEVIEFRRKYLKISRLDVSFAGKFERTDGTKLVFPADTMGHMCLMVFWSKDKPGTDAYLDKIKASITNTPVRVDVFSFNVDELPDGGASFLQEKELNCTVIRLPGGRNNQAYRTYAQGDPVAVLVNEYGFSVIRPEIVHGRMDPLEESRMSEERYSVHLQSLFIGDFLVADGVEPVPPETNTEELHPDPTGGRAGRSLPAELQEIDDCFVVAPFRYRLTRAETLANYAKAERLCSGILQNEKEGSQLWRARDRKIVALLGMWNLDCEPKYLSAAVKEAKLTLAAELPMEAQVVSRFCLAKQAMRSGGEKPELVVSSFLDDCGGEDAPASAIAAVSVLAIDARNRDLYDKYRSIFLDKHADNPKFYDFTAFLRDRHDQYRVLMANHTLRERRARGYIVGHGYPWPTNYLPRIELTKLDGSKLRMPEDTKGKMTYLLFVEPPPGGGTNNWYVTRDSRGNVRGASGVYSVMQYANDLTQADLNGDINFVAAFLTDDAEHVKYLVQTNGWSCQPVMVPGGLKNPMVRQLGILSADKFPNVFLLRRDGSIAWRGSGLRYKNEFGYPFAVLLAMKVHVEVCDMEYGYKALKRGSYKEAVKIFSGPFPEQEPQRYAWRSPRYHAKALAYVGLKDWEAALDSIDNAIDAHKLRHFHGYGRRSKIADWRKDAEKVTIKEPCDIICMLWTEKAAILDKLGRKEEADKLRKRGEKPTQEHYSYVYEQFQQKLNDLGLLDK